MNHCLTVGLIVLGLLVNGKEAQKCSRKKIILLRTEINDVVREDNLMVQLFRYFLFCRRKLYPYQFNIFT